MQRSMNKETNAEVLDATTFTLYIPDFVQEYSLSGQTLDEQNTQLLQKDRLTPGLIHEIETLFPNPSEINSDDDNRRDSNAFQRKIALLFPCGRIFASFKQLDRAVDMFLVAWAIKKTMHSKSIQYSYSSTHDKKDRKHPNPDKRRKLEPALKLVYKFCGLL
jgi:hypothetical protein